MVDTAMARKNSRRSEAAGKAAFRLGDYPFIYMADIIFRINQNLLVALRPSGISIPMWRVLAILQETDGLPLSQLSAVIFVERSALSRVIDAMEEAGMVRREVLGRDRRYTRVFLCKEGRRKFEQIVPLAQGQIEWALQGLDRRRVQEFEDTLHHIIGNFDRLPNLSRRVRSLPAPG
jgi:DNA-binding MarR family transcriptional regulator